MVNKIKYLAGVGLLGIGLVGSGCRDDQFYVADAQRLLEVQRNYEQSEQEQLQEDYADFSKQREFLIKGERDLRLRSLESNNLLESAWESEGLFKKD